MNRERLTKLAEWLEAGAQHETIVFDIRTGITFDVKPSQFDPDEMPACETSCCIAGAAVHFFGDTKDVIPEDLDRQLRLEQRNPKTMMTTDVPWAQVQYKAQDLLDLTFDQAYALFTPHPLKMHNDPAWAARTIRGFIESGIVDWAAHERP